MLNHNNHFHVQGARPIAVFRFKNHKNREAIPRRVLYSGNCEEMHMLQRLSYTQLYVLDQDAARDFYVDKLGFEVRTRMFTTGKAHFGVGAGIPLDWFWRARMVAAVE